MISGAVTKLTKPSYCAESTVILLVHVQQDYQQQPLKQSTEMYVLDHPILFQCQCSLMSICHLILALKFPYSQFLY